MRVMVAVRLEVARSGTTKGCADRVASDGGPSPPGELSPASSPLETAGAHTTQHSVQVYSYAGYTNMYMYMYMYVVP